MLSCGAPQGAGAGGAHGAFNPAVQAVERLGVRPKFIETHRISPFTFRSADVGVVFDMMIHDIDILLHLMRDEVVRVDAVASRTRAHETSPMRASLPGRRGGQPDRLAPGAQDRAQAARLRGTAYVSLDYQKKVGIAVTRDKNLDVLQMARERNCRPVANGRPGFRQAVRVEPLMIDDRDRWAPIEAFIDCVRIGRFRPFRPPTDWRRCSGDAMWPRSVRTTGTVGAVRGWDCLPIFGSPQSGRDASSGPDHTSQ